MDMREYFPGQSISLAEKLNCTIFPIGLKHVPMYVANATATIQELVALPVMTKEGKVSNEQVVAHLPQIIGIIHKHLSPMIADTVTFSDVEVKFDDLPHFAQAQVINAWLDENFTKEGRLDPWQQAIGSVYTRVTGKSFSSLEIFSKTSSPAVGSTPTSSTQDKKVGPTPVGPSSSGTPVHKEPRDG